MTGTVKVKLTREFRAFPVPDEVTVVMPPGKRENGFVPAITMKTSELDDEALLAMAQQWVLDLYRAAGKDNPPTVTENHGRW